MSSCLTELAKVQTVVVTSAQLRVYLAPAPGAGATLRMLDEGNRRKTRGTDVVIGIVNTHERRETMARIGSLETVPARHNENSAGSGTEMDIDAIVVRDPEVVLVDDLGARNGPSAAHRFRWEQVQVLLEAGYDVITTVNVAELESVQDVVESLTGVRPSGSVPDAIVRGAQQIELVDITPQALRRRLAHGNIFPAGEVDAALSNYYREENLAALRQLAMLWTADRIEESLKGRTVSDLSPQQWETRERLIVGVSGTNEDEFLLRRAARISARTNTDLLALHVVDSKSRGTTSIDMSSTRAYVAKFGGIYQEIVDDNVAAALIDFARLERGTQIVLGSSGSSAGSRRSSGVVGEVLRNPHDLDVHIVTTQHSSPSRLRRRRRNSFSWRRRIGAVAAATLLLPLLTYLLTLVHSSSSLSLVFPTYLVAVIALTVAGGALVGVLSALAASLLENYFFIAPRHTFAVSRTDDLVTLSAFLAFSIAVSVVVTEFTKRSNAAERARAEAEILTTAAAIVASSHDDLRPILDSLRAIFELARVEILASRDGDWVLEVESGQPSVDGETSEFRIDQGHVLRLWGAPLVDHERAMVTAFLNRLATGLRAQTAEREANERRTLSETNALRTGLLRAVSHDLRTPLASIEANVSSLLAADVTWSPTDQREILTSVEVEVSRMTRLVTNLLDAGRLEAGVVTPRSLRVELDDLIASALETVDTLGRKLEIEIPTDLPALMTDPDLYERVVANVVANACRFSPLDQAVRICAGATPTTTTLLIIDRGPGIERQRRRAVLTPLQHIDDDRSGAGLGLSVASGFMSLLGGEIRFEDTPGGGLTVAIDVRQSGQQ
jgi:two-component system sensor histidine kinase KdpD